MRVDWTSGAGTAGAASLAREIADAGFDGIWFAEGPHDPLLSAAVASSSAASAAARIDIGTAITVAFARNPMSVAIAANDVHQACGGRFYLGLGSQVRAHITRRFSMPWSAPVDRMREFVLALRAIFECWDTGERLDYRGEFYTHTLMTPFFSPGPSEVGRPRILLGGVGTKMTALAGEVADGFLCHPFTSPRYIRERTLPALGERAATYDVALAPLIVSGRTEEEMVAVARRVRQQIGFYASTPAYRPVLELHGYGELQPELNRLSKEGHWREMADLIDDALLREVAVTAEPDRLGGELISRFADVLTRISLSSAYGVPLEVLAAAAAQTRLSRG